MSARKHTHGMFCSVFGCSHGDAEQQEAFRDFMWSSGPASHGCVCPIGAEKSCQGPLCPRKPAPKASA